MVANYFSPLAPVVILLLSAFVLSIVTPRLPKSWRSHWSVRYVLAPVLVVLTGLVVLGIGLSNSAMLSGWHFGTAESGTGLDIGIDPTSLAFTLLTLITLLVVMLIALPLDSSKGQGWIFTVGAGAILLFVSANRLALAYTMLLFDILLAYHWLVHQRVNLSIARLFLGIFTASALMLNTGSADIALLGIALWLRLGLYPFFEIHAAEEKFQNYNFLAYWSFSLTVGIYLITQTMTVPLPEILRWLIVITMLLNGFLAWLFEAKTEEHPAHLARLIFTQASLLLLLIVPSTEINIAFAFGLTLSLAALWVPLQSEERININNPTKLWPYLAPLMATLTLIGFPFSLGWPVWATFYSINFPLEIVKTIVAMSAVILALSGLTRYWLRLWYGQNTDGDQSRLIPTIAAIIAAVPFLIPGLAPLIISTIMQSDLPVISNRIPFILTLIAITTAGAIGLGYFRAQIITRFNVPPATLIKVFDLQWLLIWTEKVLNQIGKFVLRVNVILEGQHYMGWAVFTALVGTLIVILMRSA